jgi:hypothetical protein
MAAPRRSIVMATLTAAEIIVPKDLDPTSKRQLIDALYDVHTRIFDGVDKASFARYVVDSTAEHTWIQIYRGEQDQIAGYFAVHVFEREFRGETVAIIRGEAGVLRRYRGSNVIAAFMADRVFRYKLRRPGRTMYYLGSLVHPSSYTQLARYMDEVWPREGEETPADVKALMSEMGESFGLEIVDEENPLVRKVGWKTIDLKSDREYWRTSDRPGAQFFLAANPGYAEGNGLLTLAPFTLGGFVQGLGRYVSSKVAKRGRICGPHEKRTPGESFP